MPSSSSTPEDKAVVSAAQNAYKNAKTPLEKLRAQCLKRGCNGIRGLGRAFRIFDDNRDKSLSLAEFSKGCKDYQLHLTPDEIQIIFTQFDKDGSGTLDFDEFLRALRPPMSDNRKNVIMLAFKKLDKTGDGIITIEDLKGVYKAREHPKYKNGEWTEAEVFKHFLSQFEKDSQEKDGVITTDEFIDYYAAISISMDTDIQFDFMMRSAWKI